MDFKNSTTSNLQERKEEREEGGRKEEGKEGGKGWKQEEGRQIEEMDRFVILESERHSRNT